jgi:hypothetical protein
VNNTFVKMRKEAFVAKFEILRRHLSEGTEKYHENPPQEVSGYEAGSDHQTETFEKSCIAFPVH